MHTERAKRLLEGNIPYLVFSFSLPAMVGMVAQALYNIIDRIFVGRALGSNAIAGTTVSFPFMAIIMAFGMLIGIGSAALVSMRLGEGKHEKAEEILGNAIVLLIIAAICTTSLGTLFLDPLLVLFGASPTILPYAHDYMQIILCGSIFQTLGFGLNALIRAEGNPRMSMMTMLISVLLNAVLAPIFIFVLQWGMKGAALATVIAQAVAAIWVVGYFVSKRSMVAFHWRNMRLNRPICQKILIVGSPPFVMHIAASITNSLINHQLYREGGDLAISVMGIIFAFSMFVCMPVFGINQGAQPIIGFNYGARRFDRVKHALKSAILGASSITSLGFFVAVFLPTQVVRLFNDQDAALIGMGSHAMRIALFMLPLGGFQIICTSYFQAIGKAPIAMLLSLSRQVLLLIPLVLLLVPFMGLDGIWYAMPTADCVAALWSGLWLAFELRKLAVKHALEPVIA